LNSPQLINIQNDEFKRSLVLSVVVHALLVIFLTVKMVYYKPAILDLSQAIRVDMVGLPDKIQEAPAEKTEKTAEPKVEPKQVIEKLPEKVQSQPAKPGPQVIDLKKNKNKQKDALEKLKKMSAIEKIKQDLRSETLQKQALDEANKKIIKGRVISAGSAITGLDKIEANSYLQALDQQVKEHWTLPQWLVNKPLKARVHVKFNSAGQISSAVIMQTSGEPTYDNYCLQAVTQAAPFPQVPEKLSEKFSVDGVVIGFPE
jgi:colicin import membrane protein